ncbi:MAG: AAA family ATPase [Myxococcota bacterium]
MKSPSVERVLAPLPSVDGDLERRLLATLIRDPDAFDEVAELLQPADFDDPRARRLFQVFAEEIGSLARGDDGSIDVALLARRLAARRDLENCGGPVALAEIQDLEPGSAQARLYAREIRRASVDRAARRLGRKIAEQGLDGSTAGELDEIAAFLADPDGRGAATGQPIPLIPFAEIGRPVEDDYLVKGLLSRHSLAAEIGASGSSKSFVAVDLALHVASGTPWRGLRTRRGRVVYIAAEGAAGLRNRITAARKRLALGSAETVEFYLVPDVVRLVEGSDDVDRLVSTVRGAFPNGRADLFILDTLSRSIAGRDENSSQDMTEAIAQADRLRVEFGAAVLILHHSGKDESRGARGHSSLRAALDTELEVRKLDGTYTLTLTKSREHETGRVWHHRLEPVELGTDADGDPITSCIVRPVTDADDLEFVAKPRLNAHEERTLTALRALLDVAMGTGLTAPDSASKESLREWVERHAGVPHATRRNVVLKGLKGLKSKGIVEIEGERVFLVREDFT